MTEWLWLLPLGSVTVFCICKFLAGAGPPDQNGDDGETRSKSDGSWWG